MYKENVHLIRWIGRQLAPFNIRVIVLDCVRLLGELVAAVVGILLAGRKPFNGFDRSETRFGLDRLEAALEKTFHVKVVRIRIR